MIQQLMQTATKINQKSRSSHNTNQSYIVAIA